MNVMPMVETTIHWTVEGTPMGRISIKNMNLAQILSKKDNERILDTIYDAIQKKGYKPIDLNIRIFCTMMEKEQTSELDPKGEDKK